MRRGANAMTVSGVTGQTASRPDSGSRVIDEAKVDAARLGTFSRSPRSIEPRHIRRGAKRLAILADPNATATTNDCWPNLGLRGPGVLQLGERALLERGRKPRGEQQRVLAGHLTPPIE
jgi:hypothetical protein